MKLYRYNVTNPEEKTLSVVAKSAAQAREKAWYRWTRGVPFMNYLPSSVLVTRLEEVQGPQLMEDRP